MINEEKWNEAIKDAKYLVERALTQFKNELIQELWGFEMYLGDKTIQIVISDKDKNDLSKLFDGD